MKIIIPNKLNKMNNIIKICLEQILKNNLKNKKTMNNNNKRKNKRNKKNRKNKLLNKSLDFKYYKIFIF